VFETTVDGRVLFANDALALMLGYRTGDELVASVPDATDLWCDPERRPRLLRVLRQRGRLSDVEVRVRRRDGATRTLSVCAIAARESPNRVRGVAVDVTEREQAMKSLVRSEARYRSSTEAAMDAFSVYEAVRDDAGRITDFRVELVNQAACRLCRTPREEMLGRTLFELFPMFAQSGLFEKLVVLVEIGVPLVLDEFLCDDVFGGERMARFLDLRAVRQGERVVLTARDASDRVAAARAAGEREERYRTLIQHAAAGVFEADGDGALVLVNPAFAAMLGFPSPERTLAEVGALADLFVDPVEYRRLVRRLSERRRVADEECALRRRDGSTLRVSLALSAIGGEGRRFDRAAGIVMRTRAGAPRRPDLELPIVAVGRERDRGGGVEDALVVVSTGEAATPRS
jgi:PAS domain S-box-containing protein